MAIIRTMINRLEREKVYLEQGIKPVQRTGSREESPSCDKKAGYSRVKKPYNLLARDPLNLYFVFVF